jgi:hypothetical protein
MEPYETLYYQDESVRITSAAAEFGMRKFITTSITSVELVQQRSDRTWSFLAIIIGCISMAVGTLATLNGSINYFLAAACIGVGLIVAMLGLALLIKGSAYYIVRIATDDEEVDALTATEEERSKRIVGAVNAAILGKD